MLVFVAYCLISFHHLLHTFTRVTVDFIDRLLYHWLPFISVITENKIKDICTTDILFLIQIYEKLTVVASESQGKYPLVSHLVAVTIPDSMRQDGHSFAKERSYQVWRRHQYLQVRANDNSRRRRYHDLVWITISGYFHRLNLPCVNLDLRTNTGGCATTDQKEKKFSWMTKWRTNNVTENKTKRNRTKQEQNERRWAKNRNKQKKTRER